MRKMNKKTARMIATMTMAMTLAASPGEVRSQLLSTPNQVIDCGQVLFRKPVTVHFEITNQGKGAVTIKEVQTSCGCINVSYPKGMITENKPFVVTASYDAKQMGHFEKYIDVFTKGASLPFTLTIKGVVVEELKDYGGEYQFVMGKLKTDTREVFFDDILMGDNPVAEIHLLNTSSEMATPTVLNLPSYLKADISPSSIPPGRSAELRLTLATNKMEDYGLEQASVFLAFKAGERPSQDKEIHVTSIVLPSLGEVTDQQIAYLPKMKISSTTLDLGEFEGKKKKKGTLVIENLGRTNLEISKVQMFTEGLLIDLSSNVIQPGQTAKLKVTADQKVIKGVKRQPQILLITNDPKKQKVIIDINVK